MGRANMAPNGIGIGLGMIVIEFLVFVGSSGLFFNERFAPIGQPI